MEPVSFAERPFNERPGWLLQATANMDGITIVNIEGQVQVLIFRLDKVSEQLCLPALERNCLDDLPLHIEQAPWGDRRHWVEAFQLSKDAIIKAENKIGSHASFNNDATYDKLEQAQSLLTYASIQVHWLEERARKIAYAANLAQTTSRTKAQPWNEPSPRRIPDINLAESYKSCDMDPITQAEIIASIRHDIPITSTEEAEPSSSDHRRFAELLAAFGPFSNASVSATETYRIQNAITQPFSNDIHILRHQAEHPVQNDGTRSCQEKQPRDKWECDFCGETCFCKILPNKDKERGA